MSPTDAQRDRIEHWLDEHWRGQAACPAGHTDWEVAPNLSFMPGFMLTDTGPNIAHDRGFTFVVLTCTECGYVAFLDTGTVGLSA